VNFQWGAWQREPRLLDLHPSHGRREVRRRSEPAPSEEVRDVVCGVEPGQRNLMRDHEHQGAGWPRGLLCWRHNVGIEMFSDDPELLRAAADYLDRATRQRAASEEGTA
jgi:hypothetical protein